MSRIYLSGVITHAGNAAHERSLYHCIIKTAREVVSYYGHTHEDAMTRALRAIGLPESSD